MVLKRTDFKSFVANDEDVTITSSPLCEKVIIYFFFFGEAAFLAFDAAGDFAVFGFGALGFLVGPALLDFLAFEGDLVLGAATAVVLLDTLATFFSPTFFGDFFSAAAFLAFEGLFLAALACLSPDAAFFTGDFLVLTVVFFLSDDACFVVLEPEAASLNDPEAPFPLVCTKAPETTADFKYFLINEDTFSASTL